MEVMVREKPRRSASRALCAYSIEQQFQRSIG
jgi:hypothetical protein